MEAMMALMTEPALGDVNIVKGFLPQVKANHYLPRLLALPWQHVTWSTGRKLPRLTYSYSGGSAVLDELKSMIEGSFGVTIRSIWCNQYRNNQDYTPEHQDSYGGYVFTLSFGATRRLIFRNHQTNQKMEFVLENGDLNYFSPLMNATHKHSVPKGRKSDGDGVRVSVVFFA